MLWPNCVSRVRIVACKEVTCTRELLTTPCLHHGGNLHACTNEPHYCIADQCWLTCETLRWGCMHVREVKAAHNGTVHPTRYTRASLGGWRGRGGEGVRAGMIEYWGQGDDSALESPRSLPFFTHMKSYNHSQYECILYTSWVYHSMGGRWVKFGMRKENRPTAIHLLVSAAPYGGRVEHVINGQPCTLQLNVGILKLCLALSPQQCFSLTCVEMWS